MSAIVCYMTKQGQILFFHRDASHFFRKVDSNDLIGPTENVLLVAQKMSKYCLNPFNLFFEICPIL